MKRRTFIQKLAATGMILPMAMGFPRLRAFAQPPENSPFTKLAAAQSDRILIIIRIAGGNDGLNTIVPYTNAAYYAARSEGAVSIAENEAVKLPGSDTLGLHPELSPLKQLFEEKKLAIVQNVAYPNQNLSHFRSTDIWLSGSDANVYSQAGWYAKYLEEIYPDYPDTLPAMPFAIELGTYLSTTLIGEKNNMGIAITDLSYVPGMPDSDHLADNHEGDEEKYVREIMRQTNVFSNSIIAAAIKQSTNKAVYPTGNKLADALAAIVRVIAGGLTTQMYIVNVGGYDTHSSQLVQQANLHKQFAEALLAFQRDIEAFGLDKRIALMTISEFGRRVASNGTGTDHGAASPIFALGTSVNGGFYGREPNLEDLDNNGNLKMEYDFRQLYASVLSQWFGAADSELTPGPLPRTFAQLPVFQRLATGANESGTFAANGLSLGQNYPNPAIAETIIPFEGIGPNIIATLTISTIEGREILREQLTSGQTALRIDVRKMPAGAYIYEIRNGSARITRSMTVLR